LEAKPSALRTTNDPCLGIGRIVVFGGPWVSNEIWEEVLVLTVKAEALHCLPLLYYWEWFYQS
jgi:hypothetical protein